MSTIYRRRVMGLALVSVITIVSSPLCAQPVSTIRTPPAANFDSLSNEDTLRRLALANVIASNCEIPGLTKGDAGLLAGTAQVVADRLGITTEVYFAEYIHPAMGKIATPKGCEQNASIARDLVEIVKALGGEVLTQ